METVIAEPLRQAIESVEPDSADRVTAAAMFWVGKTGRDLGFVVCAEGEQERADLGSMLRRWADHLDPQEKGRPR